MYYTGLLVLVFLMLFSLSHYKKKIQQHGLGSFRLLIELYIRELNVLLCRKDLCGFLFEHYTQIFFKHTKTLKNYVTRLLLTTYSNNPYMSSSYIRTPFYEDVCVGMART